MSNSFTPGPWKFGRVEPGFRKPDKGDFQIIAPNWLCPAIVWGDGGTPGEANARLIATSPRMYDYIAQRAAGGDLDAVDILESINAAR